MFLNAKVFSVALVALAAAPAAAQTGAPPGAAACSGCHPPAAVAGITVPPLNGRPAADIVHAMNEFRAGRMSPTVMDRIAKGFTPEETQAIAAWFAAQR